MTRKTSKYQERLHCDPADLPVPPDGGWGWLVVLASFTVNVIVDGVCFTFGIFYVSFLDHFGASRAKTSWVGSLVPGMYLSLGPVVSALSNKYGCRAVTMSGGVVSCIAFILCTFSNDIDMLIFTYGFLGGLGFGLMYLPSIVIVGFYFDKRRAFATGLAVCGTGVGTLLFAPIGSWLIKSYGWKGGMWVIAGICLNGLACGAIYRPLEANMKKPPKEEEAMTDSTQHKSIIMQRIIDEKRLRCNSTGSLDGTLITRDNRFIRDKSESQSTSTEHVHSNGTPNGKVVTITSNQEEHHGEAPIEAPLLVNKHLLNVKSTEPRQRNSSQCSTTGSKGSLYQSQDNLEAHRRKEAARPMYRQDIFYAGSLASLSAYKSTTDMSSYAQSITSIPEMPDDPSSCKARCLPLTTVLKDMFDFSLMRSPTFLLLVVTSILAMIGFFTPFVFLTDYAIGLGYRLEIATLLISVMGITNTVGRVMAGWVSDRPWADCLIIHNVALIIAGSVTCCVPLFRYFPMLVIYCCVFGLCIAAFVALRSIVLVELLGVQKLTNSLGILLLFQGLACIIGSPIAGWLYDTTGSYTVSFVSSGMLIAVAGLICLPVRRLAAWENGRKMQNSTYVEVRSVPAPEPDDDV